MDNNMERGGGCHAHPEKFYANEGGFAPLKRVQSEIKAHKE